MKFKKKYKIEFESLLFKIWKSFHHLITKYQLKRDDGKNEIKICLIDLDKSYTYKFMNKKTRIYSFPENIKLIGINEISKIQWK